MRMLHWRSQWHPREASAGLRRFRHFHTRRIAPVTYGSRALVLLCLLAGCQGTSQVFDNPVVGPPPPRVSQPGIAIAAQDPADDSADLPNEPGEIGAARLELANFSAPDPKPAAAFGKSGEVAARVNGTPIFAAQVLQPYAAELERFRSTVSPAEFARMQRNLVQRDLPHYIETAALVDIVHAQMNDEQKTAVNKQLDVIFEEQLAALMKVANVQSVPELDALLKSKGTNIANEMQCTGESIAEIRKSFGEKALSGQYLREAVGNIAAPTRKELLAEYESRVKDYSKPTRVKWQQLQVSFAVHNGEDNARLALARARQDLQAGMPFDEVVRKHGDGPLAKLGGAWDWTQPDSVSDAGLREALTSLKDGEVGNPIQGDKAWMLVKVTEKQEAHTTAFDEVQNELRTAIAKRKRDERVAEILKDVMSKAVIETIFDGEQPKDDRQVSPVKAENPPSS